MVLRRIRGGISKILGWSITPYLTLIVILFYLLFPIYWLIITSFKTQSEVFQWPPTFFPADFTFSNYLVALAQSPVPIFILNSLIYSLSAAAFVVTIGTLTTYGLSFFRYRGSEKITFTFFATRFVPPQALWLPFVILFIRLGLGNTRTAVIIFETMLVYPLSIIMLKSIFDAFPRSLIDAASLDGCSRIGTLIKVVIPITAPAIAAVAIIAFLWTWGDFMFPFLILNTTNLYPITVGIFHFVGDVGVEWGPISAASVITILPGLIFFTIAQRHIVSGMTRGAFK